MKPKLSFGFDSIHDPWRLAGVLRIKSVHSCSDSDLNLCPKFCSANCSDRLPQGFQTHRFQGKEGFKDGSADFV
jgi:hypothetical protein